MSKRESKIIEGAEETEEERASRENQEKEQAMIDGDVVRITSTYIPSKWIKKWIKDGMADDFNTKCAFVEKVTADGLGNKVYYMPEVKS